MISGSLNASDRVAAYQKLSSHYDEVISLAPVSLVERVRGEISGKVRKSDLAVWLRQFSIMLSSGVGISRSLELGRNGPNPALNNVLSRVHQDIRQGMPLSKSLEQFSELFDRKILCIIKAGEVSGKLPALLNRLADDLERSLNWENKLKSALFYPAFIVLCGSALFVGFAWGIAPVMSTVFSHIGVELPFYTKLLFGFSDLLRTRAFMWSVAGLGAVTLLASSRILRMIERRVIPVVYDLIKWIPLLGPIMEGLESAGLLRAFSSLLNAGVPLLRALKVLRNSFRSKTKRDRLNLIYEGIEGGRSLGEMLDQYHIFPRMVVYMLSAAEEAGELPRMMEQAAYLLEIDVEYRVRSLLAMIEPISMLVLGLVTGGVVISAFMPLIQVLGAFLEQV